jgi:hypothetical protein
MCFTGYQLNFWFDHSAWIGCKGCVIIFVRETFGIVSVERPRRRFDDADLKKVVPESVW